MTYGWAILVIVLVIGILYVLLNGGIQQPEGCVFKQPGFDCQSIRPLIQSVNSNAQVKITVNNRQSDAIMVLGYFCTERAAGNIKMDDAKDTQQWLAAPVRIVPGGNAALDLKCYGQTNAALLSKQPNDKFQGTFFMWYRFENDPAEAARKAEATVTGTVLEG